MTPLNPTFILLIPFRADLTDLTLLLLLLLHVYYLEKIRLGISCDRLLGSRFTLNIKPYLALHVNRLLGGRLM